jgi:hypothetical protein
MIAGIKLDVAAVCSPRLEQGEEINQPEAIDADRVEKLKDLIGLLKWKSILKELGAQLAAEDANISTDSALAIIGAMEQAQGDTSVEKYFNALVDVCQNNQCSGLPSADRAGARRRHELLSNAMTELLMIELSQNAVSALVALEANQSGIGVVRTLAAVNALIDQMKNELNLAQDQLNEQALNSLIASQCQAGVVPIVTPPIRPVCSDEVDNDGDTLVDYPNDPGCVNADDSDETDPAPSKSIIDYRISLMPSYALPIHGSEASSLEAGPSLLRGNVALAFDLPEEFKLQFDYRCYLNNTNEFTYGRVSQDFAAVTLTYKRLVFQGAFLYESTNLEGRDEYLGAVGFGAELYDKLFYPFGGVSFWDSSVGGYAGVRSSYTYEKARIGVSAEVLYDIFYQTEREDLGQRVGGLVIFTWSPATVPSFWVVNESEFQIGLAASGAYDLAVGAGNVSVGLVLRLVGDLLAPQSIRWGGF